MKKAQAGDTVRIHYTGTLDDGTQFDSSEGRDPIEFTLGSNRVIPGFEAGVKDMQVGEQKQIHIVAEEAYGARNESLVEEVPLQNFPQDMELNVGMRLQAQNPNGENFTVMVTALGEKTATLDGNHPLAGEDLNFELELVEIV